MTIAIVGPQVTWNFCPPWQEIRDSHDLLPLDFDFLLEQLTELREDVIQDTYEQQAEEIRRARSGRVLSAGGLSP